MFIKNTLQSLKERLNSEQAITITGEQGELLLTTCIFKPSIVENEITDFENIINSNLPEDYKEFLRNHNGANFFQVLLDGSINIGGGLELFSINEVLENKKNLGEDSSFIPIGYISENYLMINLESVKAKNPNYLYINSLLEARSLELNLEIFLDRYIISQGASFWNWTIYTAENYYKLKSN
jgi:hypothetical protein